MAREQGAKQVHAGPSCRTVWGTQGADQGREGWHPLRVPGTGPLLPATPSVQPGASVPGSLSFRTPVNWKWSQGTVTLGAARCTICHEPCFKS